MPASKVRRVALDLRSLSGRDDLFRVAGATKRDAAVEAWLTSEPAVLRAMAQRWFARMRRCGSDVVELMHDGCPVACVKDAPFAYVNTFKSHINVGFFRGAQLEDPAALLEGSGKRMRHVKIRPEQPFDAVALAALIDAAYAEIKARLRAERSSGS